MWDTGYQEIAALPLDVQMVLALFCDLDGQWCAEPNGFQGLMVERDAVMMLYLWCSKWNAWA